MRISKLRTLLLSLKEQLDKGLHFSLDSEDEHLICKASKMPDVSTDYESLLLLTSLLRDSFAYLDYKAISPVELAMIGECFAITEKYLSEVRIKHRRKKTDWSPIENELISLRLGAAIPGSVIADTSSAAMRFILANDLPNKFLSLGIKCRYDDERGIAIPVEAKNKDLLYVFFDDLEKQDSLQTGKKQAKEFSYFYKNDWLFDTDSSHKLTDQFCVLDRSIAHYDRRKSSQLRATDHRPADLWRKKNLLEIELFTKQTPDYLIKLYTDTGTIYAFSIEDGFLASPPLLLYEESTLCGRSRHFIELSKEEMNTLITRFGLIRSQSGQKLKKQYLLDCLAGYFQWELTSDFSLTKIGDLLLRPQSLYIKSYDVFLQSISTYQENPLMGEEIL